MGIWNFIKWNSFENNQLEAKKFKKHKSGNKINNLDKNQLFQLFQLSLS